MNSVRAKALVLSLASLGLVLAFSVVSFNEDVVARDKEDATLVEYLLAYTACHGTAGRGDGPVAEHLKAVPSDLTVLAKNNDGVFPFVKIFHVIDGRQIIGGHGSREMPIWGQRFSLEVGDTYGPIWRRAGHTRPSPGGGPVPGGNPGKMSLKYMGNFRVST